MSANGMLTWFCSLWATLVGAFKREFGSSRAAIPLGSRRGAVLGKPARLLWVGLVLSLAAACGGGDAPPPEAEVVKPCSLNSDCSGTLICSFGLCHAQCAASKDCPTGARCVNSPQNEDGTKFTNVCQLQTESTCTFTSDCDRPFVCAVDSQCRNECKADRDCSRVAGQVCAEGGVCADAQEVDASGKFTSVPPSTRGTPAAECRVNSDCGGHLLCTDGVCHDQCRVSIDCPSGQRCVALSDGRVCQLPAESTCSKDSDCKAPLVCAADQQCRNACADSSDCTPSGTTIAADVLPVCGSGACAEQSEVDGTGMLKNACLAGDACMPAAGACHSGAVTCDAGKACMDTGNVDDGTACGSNQVCTGGSCLDCRAGDSCDPGEACKVGVLSCASGYACVVADDAPDGTGCGTNKICSGGGCIACRVGASCDAGDICKTGTQACANGPECVAEDVADGTDCGTDKVCSGGGCVECVVGDACTPANACKTGVVSCAAGPRCIQQTSNVTSGTPCGTNRVCNGGSCVTCVSSSTCTPTNDCHQGVQDCSGAPSCIDIGANIADGTPCGTLAAHFCSDGSCVSCINNSACTPANPCHRGTLNCATNPPTCTDTAANAPDDTLCGTNQVCTTGQCLTSDRVLSLTSGAGQSARVDELLTAAVVVHMQDSLGSPVVSKTVTVTASPLGAYVPPATTNTLGNASLIVRLGRATGTYTFTASSAGATPVTFTATASAPAPGTIFTVVDADHVVSTASTGVPGAGTAAHTYNIYAVAAASDGTLYLSDYARVYRLTPAGQLTRIAGGASTGFSGDGGGGTSALLYYPSDLALDEANGILYINDQYNQRVRELDLASGVIATFAGGGTGTTDPWGDNGPANQATLSNPTAISVAPNGDVYITDSSHYKIRKVDHTSTVITTWLENTNCSGPLALNTYVGPVVWDANGQAFVSGYFCGVGVTTAYGVVRRQNDGSLVRVAGGVSSCPTPDGEGIQATTACISGLPRLAFDRAGNLYTSVPAEDRVRRIDSATGKMTTVAGTGTAASSSDYLAAATATLNSPSNIAFDASQNLYIADTNNIALRAVWASGSASVGAPKLAINAGNAQSVPVDSLFTASVKLTDANDVPIGGANVKWQRVGEGSGLFAPALTGSIGAQNGVSIDTGRVGLLPSAYSFQASYTDIHGAQASGSPITFTETATAPSAGTIFTIANVNHTNAAAGIPGPGTFATTSYAFAVAAAADGSVYLGAQCAVYKLSPKGEITAFAGTGVCGFSGDSGPAVNAQLYNVYDLALDEAHGVLYIADFSNQRIRIVDLVSGVIGTFAGNGVSVPDPFGDNGPATSAMLSNPNSVSIGPDGLVYIADGGHNRIRRVDPATQVITTWLLPTALCTGTINLYSLAYNFNPRIAWSAAGDAFISGYLCGTATNGGGAVGIVKRSAGGVLSHFAGQYMPNGVQAENVDATATTFPELQSYAFDSAGNVFVALGAYHKIRRIDALTGKVTTVVGDGTAASSGDYGSATSAQTYGPNDLVVTPSGHLVFAEYNTYSFREIW